MVTAPVQLCDRLNSSPALNLWPLWVTSLCPCRSLVCTRLQHGMFMIVYCLFPNPAFVISWTQHLCFTQPWMCLDKIPLCLSFLEPLGVLSVTPIRVFTCGEGYLCQKCLSQSEPENWQAFCFLLSLSHTNSLSLSLSLSCFFGIHELLCVCERERESRRLRATAGHLTIKLVQHIISFNYSHQAALSTV